jgi:uncharacterized membrane protein YdcZ (DUF606 family)
VSKSNSKLNLLAALSGLLIAMQARANGELSHRMGNPIEAALVSFGSGLSNYFVDINIHTCNTKRDEEFKGCS